MPKVSFIYWFNCLIFNVCHVLSIISLSIILSLSIARCSFVNLLSMIVKCSVNLPNALDCSVWMILFVEIMIIT